VMSVTIQEVDTVAGRLVAGKTDEVGAGICEIASCAGSDVVVQAYSCEENKGRRSCAC
jgi:hypothetical protein